MTEDEQFENFIRALSEVQKQNDLIITDMIKYFIKSKLNSNG